MPPAQRYRFNVKGREAGAGLLLSEAGEPVQLRVLPISRPGEGAMEYPIKRGRQRVGKHVLVPNSQQIPKAKRLDRLTFLKI